MNKKANIAFYKKTQEFWTKEEFDAIAKYCNNDCSDVLKEKLKRRWIYGTKEVDVFPWHEQEEDKNFHKCEQIAYEDIFDSKNKPYIYPIYVTPLRVKAKTVIKFTALREATIVKEGIYARDKGGGFNELKGFHTNSWTPHTDTSAWEILTDYEEEPEDRHIKSKFKIGDTVKLSPEAIGNIPKATYKHGKIIEIETRYDANPLLILDTQLVNSPGYNIDEGWCQLVESKVEYPIYLEVEYPIYVESTLTGKIIKFISLKKGYKWNKIKQRFNTELETWSSHNDVSHWKEIDNPEESYSKHQVFEKKTWSEIALKKAVEESIFSEFGKTQNKETNMQTVEIKIDGKKVDLEENKVCKVKTDLERKPKWLTIWFDEKGQECDNTEDSPKEAKKQLQKPENLGKTFRSYKLTESYTTDIPVVAC